MFPSQKITKYVLLDDKDQLESQLPSHRARAGLVSRGWLALVLLISIPITATVTFFATRYAPSNSASCYNVDVNIQCSSPPIRREWRTLSKADRSRYIEAVQCLAGRPSMLGENGTAFDDFPLMHQTTVVGGHQSAPFFPWHRFAIHVYEKVLQDECGYDGVLPYWDWSQDVYAFRTAPVWDAAYGFGGDGAAQGATTIGDGRCVLDGPFTDITARYYGDEVKPHCLSRGFVDDATLNELAELVHPDAIERLMEEPEYEKFAEQLEHRAHKWITHTIRGEFSSYTGPNDPVFFLHHSNLDRLWLKWQQRHSFTAYGGRQNMFDDSPASITDTLYFGGLHANVTVADVMRTTEGMLCYQY